MKVNVGNIVFVLDNKTHNIIPCKVVEKVSSLTETGEKVYHILETPASKSFKLEDLKAPWFQDIESSKVHLMDAAQKLVDHTAQRALTAAERAFGHTEDKKTDVLIEDQFSSESSILTNEETVTVVDLGDGQKANIILPEELLHADSSID